VTWPILSALPAVPAEVLGRDVYSITQGTGPYSINDSLAQNLTAQPWTETVSPEIFSLGTLGDLAVVVRGVDPAAFLSLEDAAWTPPASWPQAWSLAGSRLAARSGRAVGDELTLVGSAIPRLGVVPLLGTFRAGSAADDELLVDYATARFLSGVGAGLYHAIRVKTSDPAALLAFLAQRGASTHVSGPGGVEGGTNTNPLPTDPRVINLFLRYGLGPLPGDYVTEGIAEATDSVQVVAWGLQILVLLLVALGLHAVQARAFADRRATVGILRALGAPGRWVRFRALREVVPLAAVAAAVGGTLGLVAATVLPSSAAILAFGHEVRVEFDPVGLGFVILAVVGVTAVSELALIGAALNERPTESIRGEPALASSRSLEVVLRD
jgi:ABC-type lipoprotein release transport system permease subunit